MSYVSEEGKAVSLIAEELSNRWKLKLLNTLLGVEETGRFKTEHWMHVHESLKCGQAHGIPLFAPLGDIDSLGMRNVPYIDRCVCGSHVFLFIM